MPRDIPSPGYVRELARKLRNDLTPSELLLWKRIRNKSLHGIRFKRQEPMGRYIVDFVALVPKVVVEIDGAVHDLRKDYDGLRDEWLKSHGYLTLRVRADEVISNIDKVLAKIVTVCSDRDTALNGERQSSHLIH